MIKPPLAVLGAGYVGVASGACFAALGHRVRVFDTDQNRINALQGGDVPFHEPGLTDLAREQMGRGSLGFHASLPASLDEKVVLIAVGTPMGTDGAADVSAVRDVALDLVSRCEAGSVLVIKSTVPVGTADAVAGLLAGADARRMSVVSNPEFLREGSAIADFMAPDRIVLGGRDEAALDAVASLYEPLGCPIVRTDPRSAEMAKYASNSFLATKISFINEIAAICEGVGADVGAVAEMIGLDHRIGGDFLSAGLGWGGSCFPKDVEALVHLAGIHGAHPQLLRAVEDINRGQRLRVVNRLRIHLGGLEGRNIAVLGASFKPSTDDTRESPALSLASDLAHAGATVRVCDPVVSSAAISEAGWHVTGCDSVETCADGADAIVLATDWPEFREIDFEGLRPLVRHPLIFDCRNHLDPAAIQAAGFSYLCIGRPSSEGGPAGVAVTAPLSGHTDKRK